jgi:hypothetical protein
MVSGYLCVMKALLLVAGLVALVAGSSTVAGQRLPTQHTVEACNAALVTVKRMTSGQVNGRPWVVAESPASADPESFAGKEEEFLSQSWQGDKPARELAHAFVTSQPKGALSVCPKITAYLDGAGIKHGEAAAHDAALDPATGRPIPVYSGTILSLSLPVISSDGHDAVVEIAVSGGWTMGAGSLHHLREGLDGEWADVGVLHTWIG